MTDRALPPDEPGPEDQADEPSVEVPESESGPASEASAEVPAGAEAEVEAEGPVEVPAEPAPAAVGPARRRVTPAGLVVALLLALLGFTLVVQVKAVSTDPTLAAARQEDLVRILSDLDAREERLRQDIADLEETQRQLTTAGQSQEAALNEAARRADELGILAGTLPVTGPGITVEMAPGAEPISAATLLDAVQELRGAGAEAIQITGGNDVQVRVVAATYFVPAGGGGVLIDGETVTGPYTLTVVGEPNTLAPALNIPGGVVESVQSGGGTVIVYTDPGVVELSAVRAPTTLQHARPAS